MKKFLLLFLFASITAFSQKDACFSLDSIPQKITGNWKYHKGDDTLWASPAFDDSKWINTTSTFSLAKLPEGSFENIGWFRLHITVDTSLVNKTIGLLLTQSGASEIYLDGKLLYDFGNIDTKDPKNEVHYDPTNLPVDIRFENTRDHVLAVRYANSRAISDFKKNDDDFPGFAIMFDDLRDSLQSKYINSNIVTGVFIFYFTFFLALGVLHFMLFRYYVANKSNLYYAIFNLAFGSTFIWILAQQNGLYPDTVDYLRNLGTYLPNIYAAALLAMLYNIFNKKFPKQFWVFFSMFFIDFITNVFGFNIPYLGILNMAILIVESIRIIIASIIKKRDGAWIIGTGVIITLAFFTTYGIVAMLGKNISFQGEGWSSLVFGILVILSTFSIPLSMTVYLARDFSRVNKNLEKKLVEVEELSAKSIEQEKEKQTILANQNAMLEEQVEERTKEIVEQKKLIEEKNKDITDSISYAKRLQQAILPSDAEIKKHLPESFLFYSPKDIVAGDFYWMHTDANYIFIAAADCTGHGVPGAMVSVVCSNALNRAVNEFNLVDTGKILDKTRELVIETFEKSDSEVKDGMDISLLRINLSTLNTNEIQVQWSGANNSLWYVLHKSQVELTEIKADKQPIGKYGEATPFTTNDFYLPNPVSFYLYSDGYADQFSSNNKKLLKKKFKDLILSIQGKSMKEQGKEVELTHTNWKGNMEQTDDVLVIGIQLK